jgi:hypothetical protein
MRDARRSKSATDEMLIAVAEGVQRRNHHRRKRWRPNDRQDQMAIRGLLGGALLIAVGAIVPAAAQAPPPSSPPQAASQGYQVPGKTPQERCQHRYMMAHNYHHIGPLAQAACPDPNQEQPNN